jgi:flagellar motor switch/type III secretory pathway protein FliN
MSASDRRSPARYAGFESVPLRVTVAVGEARCPLSELVGLERGHVLKLDRRIGEPFVLRVGEVALGLVEPVAQREGVALRLCDVVEDEEHAVGD